MPVSTMRHCKNCVYWDKYALDHVNDELCDGECHRFPPSVMNMSYDAGSKFDESARTTDLYVEMIHGTPLMSHVFTFADDWCGEFKPRKM